MPEIVDPFEKRGARGPRGAGPRGPTAVENQRLGMAATGESIQSANVNQAQGVTALAVDRAVIPSDINKRRADSFRSQMDAAEAEARSKTVGGFATEDERRTAFNYMRMLDAMAARDLILGRNKKAAEAGLFTTVVERLPLGDIAANYTVDKDRRQVVAANKALIDAALWLSTGAAYNKEQKETNYQAYFAMPNDDKATIETKNRLLRGVIEAAKARAAMGLQTVGGQGALAEITGQRPGALTAPPAAAPKALPGGMTPAGARAQAKAAIAAGKPRGAVIQRLKELGVDTTGL